MPIKIIDTHCHLDMEEFDSDRDDVIERSKNGGVLRVIIPSTKEDDFEKERLLCEQNREFLCYLVGVHPHDAKTCTSSTYDIAKHHLNNELCKGIGEIGLDYYYEHSPKNIQKEVFNNFLDLALELNLPVSIHSRESTDDMVDILKTKKGLKGVIHCFSGEDKLLKIGLNLGLYFGIGGVVTFKKSLLRQNIDKVPQEFIVFETDAPYLAPVPKRGKRNEPLYIKYVIDEICALTDLDKDEIAELAYMNSKAIFGI
jgi:TatD DNase family protein